LDFQVEIASVRRRRGEVGRGTTLSWGPDRRGGKIPEKGLQGVCAVIEIDQNDER
jgi:hypothetical protein